MLSNTISKSLRSVVSRSTVVRSMATVPPPRLFDYQQVTSNLKPCIEMVDAIENCFGKLAKDEVDVPIPMHIGIDETSVAGPGDCHIKGGYISGTRTWTVKLANVSFYKNLERGLSPGSGIFVVCDADLGCPLGIFQENRYMTDLRTGAAGAVSVKHFGSSPKHKAVGFIGAGAIAMSMALSSHVVHQFEHGYVYGLDPKMSEDFAKDIKEKLGYDVTVCNSAEECVKASDVLFTQTPGAEPVLELSWLKPHATIIASGSDQPTKNEIPPEVQKASKMITDLTRQCVRVGELRTAVKEGIMTEADVHAEIGEVVNGTKSGREGDELILVDLTGTGAQDAAIGQVAWDLLTK